MNTQEASSQFAVASVAARTHRAAPVRLEAHPTPARRDARARDDRWGVKENEKARDRRREETRRVVVEMSENEADAET